MANVEYRHDPEPSPAQVQRVAPSYQAEGGAVGALLDIQRRAGNRTVVALLGKIQRQHHTTGDAVPAADAETITPEDADGDAGGEGAEEDLLASYPVVGTHRDELLAAGAAGDARAGARAARRLRQAVADLDPGEEDEATRLVLQDLRQRTDAVRRTFVETAERALDTYVRQCVVAATRAALAGADRDEQAAALGDDHTVAAPFQAAVREATAARDAMFAATPTLGGTLHLDLLRAGEIELTDLENQGVQSTNLLLGRRASDTRAPTATRPPGPAAEAALARARSAQAFLASLRAAWGPTDLGHNSMSTLTVPADLDRRDRPRLERLVRQMRGAPPSGRRRDRVDRSLTAAIEHADGEVASAEQRASTFAEGAAVAATHLGDNHATAAYASDEQSLRSEVYRLMAEYLGWGAGAQLNRSWLRQLFVAPAGTALRGDRVFGFALGGIGTYPAHGPGAYDLHGTAGDAVVSDVPDEVDLGPFLPDAGAAPLRRRGAAEGSPEPYRLRGSRVSAASTTTESRDLLSKLVYGIYGRSSSGGSGRDIGAELEDVFASSDLEEAAAQLSTTMAARRSATTDPRRTLAGLLFAHTAGGGEVVLADRRTDLLRRLEPVVRDEVAAELDLDAAQRARLDGVGVFVEGFVEAGTGTPSIHDGIAQSFVDELGAIAGRRVLRARLAGPVTRALSTATRPGGALRQPLFELLLASYGEVRGEAGIAPDESGGELDFSVRQGASVTIDHRYRSPDGADAVVSVSYRHLRDVAVAEGASIGSGALLGHAGTTGNAVSVHIHMEIRLLHDGQMASLPPHAFFAARPQVVPAGSRR